MSRYANSLRSPDSYDEDIFDVKTAGRPHHVSLASSRLTDQSEVHNQHCVFGFIVPVNHELYFHMLQQSSRTIAMHPEDLAVAAFLAADSISRAKYQSSSGPGVSEPTAEQTVR